MKFVGVCLRDWSRLKTHRKQIILDKLLEQMYLDRPTEDLGIDYILVHKVSNLI